MDFLVATKLNFFTCGGKIVFVQKENDAKLPVFKNKIGVFVLPPYIIMIYSLPGLLHCEYNYFQVLTNKLENIFSS
jgi:hypothetical protein